MKPAQSRLSTDRWWLAAILTLLSPWLGPHVDDYLPLGYIVWHAIGAGPDAFFWVLAAGVLLVVYGLWVAILSVAGWWLSRRQSRRASPSSGSRS